MESDRTEAFTEITTLHDLDKYVQDWNFNKGHISEPERRALPLQYIDVGTMEGQALEVGITEWNGELVVALAPAGTFT